MFFGPVAAGERQRHRAPTDPYQVQGVLTVVGGTYTGNYTGMPLVGLFTDSPGTQGVDRTYGSEIPAPVPLSAAAWLLFSGPVDQGTFAGLVDRPSHLTKLLKYYTVGFVLGYITISGALKISECLGIKPPPK